MNIYPRKTSNNARFDCVFNYELVDKFLVGLNMIMLLKIS